MLPRTIKRTLCYLPQRLVLCASRRFDLGGVRLYVSPEGRSLVEKLRAKITAAVALIQTNAPNLHARVCRFIPRVLIFGAHPYNAVYISYLKLCDVSMEYASADSTTPSHLAMVLVHEATHGYLQSGGLLYTEDHRERMERLCMRTEIALARKLPQSTELIAEVEAKMSLPSDYWKSQAFLKRDIDYLNDLLKKIAAPRWLVTWAERRGAKLYHPDGAANRNQPAAPANDSTSATAGPGR